MSTNWIRGSRCGVNNCKTRYYKLIDGQRICQYGHLYEGHVEYNDEEDEVQATITKRLKIPNASQYSQSTLDPHRSGKPKKAVHGLEAKQLTLRCMQYLLRAQCKAFMKEFNLPETFETILKSFWLDYLSSLKGNLKKDGSYNFTTAPTFRHTLGLIYCTCRYMNLPIYIDDIYSLVVIEKLPYVRASAFVPKHMIEKLTVVSLELRWLPVSTDLMKASISVITQLKLNKSLKFNLEPFLLRVMCDLVLPPRVYAATRNLIKILKLNLYYPTDTTFATKFTDFPEILVCLVLLISTKIFFRDPSRNKNITGDPKMILHYHKWKRILEAFQSNRSNSRNFTVTLKNLTESSDNSSELLKWDDSMITDYLDWFQTSRLERRDDPVEGSLRRMHNLFPLDPVNTNNNHKQKPKKMVIKDTETAYAKLLAPVDELEFKMSEISPLSSTDMLNIQEIFFNYCADSFGVKKEDVIAKFVGIESQWLRKTSITEKDFEKSER